MRTNDETILVMDRVGELEKRLAAEINSATKLMPEHLREFFRIVVERRWTSIQNLAKENEF